MNIRAVVAAVLEKQRKILMPSTFNSRKRYLTRLADHGDEINISEPCQELYDSYVNSHVLTRGLRFQLYHAVRLVDSEAGTRACTPEGNLYNEPVLPSMAETDAILADVTFPIEDESIDSGFLIIRAQKEMEYLCLSASMNSQYMKAWREFYNGLYMNGNTRFSREVVTSFIIASNEECQAGKLNKWKCNVRCRASKILLEVAETGRFEWKLFHSNQTQCSDEALEDVKSQYIASLETRNLERSTLYQRGYAFRCMVEGTGIQSMSELNNLKPSQVQQMLTALSERLSLNSRCTIYPIIKDIFSYLYDAGFIPADYSGMILTPRNQKMYLRPYLTSDDEDKLFSVMENAPLRTNAMMRLAIRLGLREIDICGLKFSQIDWNNDCIVINQEKTGVSLTLPLLEDVGNAIMDYIVNERPAAAKNCPYIFVRVHAPYQKLNSMYSLCSRLLKKADVKSVNRCVYGSHVFRYSLTHKLLKAKVPHQVITDTLGHVSKESDKPYISMEEDMLRECPLDFSLIGQKYWEEGDCRG